MKLISDLHIHSRFSRATSKELNPVNIEKYARMKGINLVGTGDFLHPQWLKELKDNLREEDGILKSKTGFNFILQNEVSLMYTQGGRGRRVHLILLAPSFDVVEQMAEYFRKLGRIDYDGRPIFGKSAIEVTAALKSISGEIEIIPAHILTPWFGLLGSKSGFDSVEEAFMDQTKHIHALETGLSCYDKKTEVLTEDGWKKFPDIRYADKICTLNPSTDEIEFQNPTKMFEYNYNGKMYHLKTKRVDLLVTPNHRLLVSGCDFRRPPRFFLREAESLFNRSKLFKKDGCWNGREIRYFTLPAVKIKHGSRYYSGFRDKTAKQLPIEAWLKFFGFWIAEGWATQGKGGDYAVYVANKNKDLLNEMKRILESLGYTVYCDSKTVGRLRVRDYQLFHYLKQFGKCYDKFIPTDIKSLSKELLAILLEYYIKGDGHRYGRSGKGLSATTTSVRLRDDLQEIALKLGVSAYYKLGYKKGRPFSSPSQGKIYKQRNDSWVIYFIRKNVHAVLPSTIKKWNYTESWVDFDGLVFCVSVPNQVMYVRRNGIPVWCGNSDPAMNWRLSSLDRFTLVSFSDAHSLWPWRLGREATLFDLKKLAYKNLIKAIRDKDGYAGTVEVNPAYGKYHFDGHRLCKVRLSPEQTRKLGGICPKCRNPLTVGVEYRVEELADRPQGFKPKGAVPYYTLLPLSELISTATSIKQLYSQKIWQVYNKLIEKFGSEFAVLLEAPEDKLKEAVDETLAKLILQNRRGEITVSPGYDGVYGKAVLGGEPAEEEIDLKNAPQKSLFDY